MPPIYVDPSALKLMSSNPAGTGDRLVPGAAEAVGHLVDAGLDVIVLQADDDESIPPIRPSVSRTHALPEHLDRGAWYVTGDPSLAAGRPRGGTTVLVGPRLPAGKLPPPRVDLEARDMTAAAMLILMRDAMA